MNFLKMKVKYYLLIL